MYQVNLPMRSSKRTRDNHYRILGKISAKPYTIVKQIFFPNSDVLFLSLFSLLKN